MRFLCLIFLNEDEMDALPADEMHGLNVGHLALNEELRADGRLVEAEALEPAAAAVTVRPRRGRPTTVTDGPFAESKELVAGFYLIEAADRDEAIAIAARFPGAQHGAVEIRQVRPLLV
jgi:hypothetical protein